MGAVVFLVLSLGIATAVVFIVFRIKKGGVTALLLKTGASLLFVLTALLCVIAGNDNTSSPESFYAFIIMGLVLGLVGDVMLDLKMVYKEHSDIYTFSGMVCFLSAHVFYVLAIMLNYTLSAVSVIVPILAALAIASSIILSAPLFKLDLKKFKVLSFIYSFFLSWTMCQSFSAAIVTEYKPVFSVIFLASVLFAISDIILSHMYFSLSNNSQEPKDRLSGSPLMIGFNHGTYYAAQYLIALSIMLI